MSLSGQVFGQGPHVLHCENDRTLFTTSEFHQCFIISASIESDRHVLAFVWANKENTPQQNPVGIESRTDACYAGTHVNFRSSDTFWLAVVPFSLRLCTTFTCYPLSGHLKALEVDCRKHLMVYGVPAHPIFGESILLLLELFKQHLLSSFLLQQGV